VDVKGSLKVPRSDRSAESGGKGPPPTFINVLASRRCAIIGEDSQKLAGPGCEQEDVICSLGPGPAGDLELHPRQRWEGRIPRRLQLALNVAFLGLEWSRRRKAYALKSAPEGTLLGPWSTGPVRSFAHREASPMPPNAIDTASNRGDGHGAEP